MAGIAPRIFWSKGYALMPSATKTIDMALPSFIKQVLLLNSFSCLFLYSYLICKLLFAFDEGRTLPNLLGCLLSRRFPVHASES